MAPGNVLVRHARAAHGPPQPLARAAQAAERLERGQPLQRQNNRFRGPAQPRHLDTMLIAKQIQTYCKQINNFSSDAFGKLFLVANKPVGAN